MKRLLVLTLTVMPVLTTHAGQITLILSDDRRQTTRGFASTAMLSIQKQWRSGRLHNANTPRRL